MRGSKFLFVIIIYCIIAGFVRAATWQENLNALLADESADRQDKLISKIVKAEPSYAEVADYLQNMSYPEILTDSVYLRKTTCIDGVERSWILYVPPSYDRDVPTPLLVNLHGGVSRAEPIADSAALEFMGENYFKKMARREGWLFIYPFGQAGAVWWDSVGMANINNLVRTVKREFNVDDDRVWMGGYSDGASASLCYGMTNPTDYAAFLALSGHIGVGSLDGGLETYAVNLANTPTYAITSFDDELYPSARMRPTIQMAVDAGGDILYREQDGHHDFSYAEAEYDNIVSFLNRHPRDPFPSSIVWETADTNFGLCSWFSIDAINPDSERATWHVEHNVTLTDERVTIGFMPEQSDEPGVRVGSVMEETAAFEMGLQDGDIIVRGGDMKINDYDALNAFKATKKRGDSLHLTVIRDDAEVALSGKLPDVTEYTVFNHQLPSARADVSFFANSIDIQASRVEAFSVLVHPDMIRLEHPLVIQVNGIEVYNEKVKPDLEFMLRNYLRNRDRKLLYVAEVEIIL